ncbi:MAG: ABC transporter ATP-binding protein [Bifidobacteriaceae bacterium]|nr:ABC transporter ATP-binding protein [Bifidobacteriaceae bacterium]
MSGQEVLASALPELAGLMAAGGEYYRGPIVQVKDLQVAFGEGSPVARGVSFALTGGECLALVGESGAGKSVTARSLLGLAGPGARVTATELRFRGHNLLAAGKRHWRELRGKGIGLISQDALVSLDPLRTIGAEIGEGLQVHTKLGRRERRFHTELLLGKVGVPEPHERVRQYPHQLSGGLRQRALIASALAGSPQVLIADEATTALDVVVQAQILRLFADLKAAGAAILLVSHDLAAVAAIADRILVMKDGEVVEAGPTRQVLTRPDHPYTRRLIAAVPSAHTRSERLSDSPVADFAALRGLAKRPSAAGPDRAAPDGIVRAEHLRKIYRLPGGREIRALDDVSFSIRAGQTLGIVGNSGSGKTTAAQVVLGHVEPDSGTVLFLGKRWSGVAEARRRPLRRRVQSISQDPLGSFDPRHTVGQVLFEALKAAGAPRAELRDQSVSLLEQVGLGAELLDASPLAVSGGQRQRVALARALATLPDLLVCDEPVSALDVSVQAQVLDLLRDLQAATGIALLFISHDLGVVAHIADQVLVMTEGRVVERGDVAEVLVNPKHPYTQSLLESVPRLPTG